MNPSEILQLLLGQHDELRRLLLGLERAADGPARRTAFGQLARALHHHIQTEEEVLAPTLPAADAWGRVRLQAMHAGHEAEHHAIEEALAQSIDAADEALGPIAAEFAARLREHMATEEQTFLTDRVLRDDLVTLDSMGG